MGRLTSESRPFTSDDYGSHAHIAAALRHVPRGEVVISTKTSAKTDEQARKSLESSLGELGTDYVDIFLLHLVKSDWVQDWRRLLKKLSNIKTTGAVKAEKP